MNEEMQKCMNEKIDEIDCDKVINCEWERTKSKLPEAGS
jgi:hypothetical protein